MSAIQISIGGRLDRSVQESFANVRKMARDAGVAVDRDLNRRRGGGGAGQNPELVAARAVHAEQSRLNREIFKQQVAAARAAHGEDLRLSRSRTAERIRELRDEARQHIASNRLVEAAAAREHSAALSRRNYSRDREVDRLATRTSHRATRFMFPRPEGALGYAHRTANELMRGIGVDMTLTGGVARATELQKQAYFLSSKGYFAGAQGAAGVRVAPEKLIEEAKSVGDKQAFDPARVLESQAAYVGLTGDLETARALMGDLAALSGATGSEMVDLGRAAGAMGNAIGEGSASGAEKANTLMSVLRVLASQGKLTAIEMDTMAKHMPKLAGASRMYSDVAKTMGEFGALGQLSMGGGAWNAASATTAMAGFTSEIMGRKAQRTLKALGIKTYDPKTKMLRSPIELIKEIVEKTGGDQAKIGSIVTGTRGGRMVNWLASEYRRNGNWDSVNKRVGELTNAGTLSKENIDEINTERMETTAAKAQKFQNNLDKVTESMASKLIPAMEKLAPTALSIASAFGNFLTWATENPGKAIGLAISIAIARAHLESIFRMALDRSIKGAYGGGGVGPGGMPTGAGAGPIGATGWMSALALGAATFTITDATLNILGKARTEQSASASQGLGRLQDEYQQKRREILSGEGTAEEKKTKLDELAKHTSTNVALTQESQAGIMSRLPDWLRRVIDSGTAIQVDESAKKFQEQIAKDMADSARLLRAASSELAQTAKTKPTVDPSGRSGNGK